VGKGGGFVYDSAGSAVNYMQGDINDFENVGWGYEYKANLTVLHVLTFQKGHASGFDVDGEYEKSLDSKFFGVDSIGAKVSANASFDMTFIIRRPH
jgi:hypothetical protein